MKYLLVIAALLISFNVIAEEELSAQEVEEICATYKSMAEEIMKRRQLERPLPDVLAIFEDPFNKQLVIKAYRYSLMTTDDGKQRSIENFGEQVYLQCYGDLLR